MHLDAAKAIGLFLDGVSEEQYLTDLLRRRAVERELEIVGEALGPLRRNDVETSDQIPGLHQAVGLRNILIHGYAQVVDQRIYATAVNDVPSMTEVLARLLLEVEEN
ncbi:MAG: HepT-like ribonuclease domain-containing protein [Corynebacterium sp.]|uniref:HepT-like ribonuclease domain-containing protein n=1 Tax=Corynebacterium sp. TaxID=1720 RepID=UPI003F946064